MLNQSLNTLFNQSKKRFSINWIKKKITWKSTKNAFMTTSILTILSKMKSVIISTQKNSFFVKKATHLHENQLVKKFRIISMCSCSNENVSILSTRKKSSNIESKLHEQWQFYWFTTRPKAKRTNKFFQSSQIMTQITKTSSLFLYRKRTNKSSKIQFEKNFDLKLFRLNSTRWWRTTHETSWCFSKKSISWRASEYSKQKCTSTTI